MKYVQIILLIVIITFGYAGNANIVYSNDTGLNQKNDYKNSLVSNSECVEYVGGDIIVLSGPSCSAGDATCSCSEGQCCSAGGGSCECNNCDDDDDEDGGIDWTILKDLLPILLP